MTKHAVARPPGGWCVEADAEWQHATQRVVVRLAFAVTDWKGEFFGPDAPLLVRGKSDVAVELAFRRSFGDERDDDDFSDVILDLITGLRIVGMPVMTSLACEAIETLQAEQEYDDRCREPSDRRRPWGTTPARGTPATEHRVSGSVAGHFRFELMLTLSPTSA